MKKIIQVSAVSALFLSVFLITRAQGTDSFRYPIAELGNCGSKAECREYCARDENFKACANFAEKHNLLPPKIKHKKTLLKEALKNKGPGGCGDEAACEAYCEEEEHQDECLAFAEKHGLIDSEELKQAKKFLPLMKAGETPGGCKSKQQCEAYCQSEENAQECLAFAEKHNLIPREELQRARKFIPLIKQGLTPGGCRSKQQCEAYCQSEDHMDECVEFGLKVGAITEKEAEMARKTKGRGPGGCRGREECEAFCNNPVNQEVCLAFAKEHGMIEEDEIKRMKAGIGQMRIGLHNAPPEVRECLKQNIDEGTLSSIESGKFTPAADTSEVIRECFEKFRPQLMEHRRQEFRANPEIEACLKSRVGEEVLAEIKSGQAPPSPELGEKMRSCFEEFGAQSRGDGGFGAGEHGFDVSKFNGPEAVKICVLGKLGGMGAGVSMENVKPVLEECFREHNQREGQGGQSPIMSDRPDFSPPLEGQQYPSSSEDRAKYEEGYRRRFDEGQRAGQEEGWREPQQQYRQYQKIQQEDRHEAPQNYRQYYQQPPPNYPQPPLEYQRPQEGQYAPPRIEYRSPEGDVPYQQPLLSPPAGKVRGTFTSRLPKFIRWLLGR